MSAAQTPRTFQMPSHSWATVKRIIRAYGAAQGSENITVENVANLAGLHRPVVSSNNNFLRSIGIVEVDKPKLTALGVKLATGIRIDNSSIITEALQDAVGSTPVLCQILNVLRARAPIDVETFRGQIILAVGLNENSPGLQMMKAISDLLEESQLVEIRDDKVFLRTQGVNDNGHVQQGETRNENKPLNAHPPQPPLDSDETQFTETPFPLGPGRLAYLRLPANWSSRELPKLLKLIELGLQEEKRE
jgi:hypothetical protein